MCLNPWIYFYGNFELYNFSYAFSFLKMHVIYKWMRFNMNWNDERKWDDLVYPMRWDFLILVVSFGMGCLILTVWPGIRWLIHAEWSWIKCLILAVWSGMGCPLLTVWFAIGRYIKHDGINGNLLNVLRLLRVITNLTKKCGKRLDWKNGTKM